MKITIPEGVMQARNFSGTDHRVVSFFAGCGGLDLGFLGGFTYKGERISELPFHIVQAFDSDEKCVVTYRSNIGNHIKQQDLADANVAVMPGAEVLIGGFPCQDFSSCGPKVGLNSKRGKLYQALVRYMDHHRPKVVVAENVPHLERIGNGKVINTIITDLKSAGPGYRFQMWRLFAPDFGVPQNRTRLFLVGVRSDMAGEPIEPHRTHSSYNTIDWAIGDLVDVLDETIPNQSQYFTATKAKNGNGQGDEISRTGKPAYTVRANAKSRVQFHYALKRRLTVRECARLQTFPDNFVFPHSATTNVMQVGNAVPPILAHQVATSIAKFLGSDQKEQWPVSERRDRCQSRQLTLHPALGF